jgi:ATP-dependent DNA helicase RecQ
LHFLAPVKRGREKFQLDWPALNRKAREYFGIKRLRPGQREIIETVLSGKSALGVMPTGAGKSLCYQLPALFLPKATIVVSPLLSLMQDQTEKMEEAGVEATKLDSTLTEKEERAAVRDVKNGHSELIYVTPERIENPEALEAIRKGGVSLLVIDEAHCVSQWGHDFRPAFLRIRQAAERLGNPPILALTATATPEVEKDILEQLGIRYAPVFSTGVDRPNLNFAVYRTVNEEMKFKKLLQIVNEVEGNGIVYVSTVRLANELHQNLLRSGIIAGKYHGKMKMSDRETTQQDFMANRYQVMVATKAFGLGIDKPDVRFVIHYTFPDSVESYYQEAGRAGRDGKKAVAALLYRLEDKRIHSYFLGGKYPNRNDAARIYQTVLELSQDSRKELTLESIVTASGLTKKKATVLLAYLEKEGILKRRKGIRLIKTFQTSDDFESFLMHYDARYLSDKEKIESIMRYGQMTECRARFFRDYFGENLGKECGNCDNCRGEFVKSVAI